MGLAGREVLEQPSTSMYPAFPEIRHGGASCAQWLMVPQLSPESRLIMLAQVHAPWRRRIPPAYWLPSLGLLHPRRESSTRAPA